MRAQKTLLLLILCLGASNLMAWNVLAQTAVGIEIVNPLDRRNVPDRNTPVTVQITGAANDGQYWELWVDEEPVVGARNGELTVTVSFKPTGPHRLKAVLFDAQSNQVATSKGILVVAAPVQERTPQFNQQMMAPIMAVFAAGVILLIFVSAWVDRRTRINRSAVADSETV